MEEQIVYEDNHLLVINKKVGQLVQGDKTGDESLLESIKNHIKKRDGKPGNVFLGLVHRIDRPTSGLVIYAKTSKALSRLTQMVKNREIKKTYWAVVPKEPLPQSQRLVHYLKKNEKNNKAIIFPKPTEGAKEAILTYHIIKSLDHYMLLEIDLETGRHHQIRAQLSKTGIPIKGDLKYGSPRSNADGGIHLHARKLEFIHPVTKERIEITAPVPTQDAIWQACEN
ncbi:MULTISPECIES: RluA family pseudouridine synthase [Chryseobacterium]|uniref:23S rRNA pseudouridine1911/1915/1917 synthase n=1 Tax=Chryseobacterium camelliae TaxID=1265445 RepID=A0ABU0TLR2_9FLAO|nr:MULTISPECIES: RluA family pseudouridine synthase [Chryseobacterium]MDT3408156.1 23S rRNA pseudouridine1911/1915/1917 synthase [Pseudacidovorax intermedius]MDQ1097988.1 23S rRNA pseudouridine1911/1915/1917 synthase [Chryseobacterium camelliae]MDQ1101917.1 23S rRNA pseudouridine1911/1915/1917 synthase [Chryseobacterium sp. SORGH_AS_1048]MDR6085357.1 23S rRNA pseudouridine1911/1915/1917 synthase [Chryseobacterium sp. SORGH_AS_0909]MDR6129715.1 23S rRNA pseudouridine1911/1915/1917 synthase [Chr